MSSPEGVIQVVAFDDERLRDYTALTDVRLRRAREPAEGLFLAEGAKVVRRALAAGFGIRSLLLADRWVALVPDLVDAARAAGAPVYVADEAVVERVTGYAVHRGPLASMARRPERSVADVAASARRLVVLEDVNDPTNIGLVLRSAAALGVDGALLSPRSADPLYRRAVKVSMGAVFSVPWARATRWPDDLAALREAGWAVLALTPAGSTGLDAVAVGGTEPWALLVGSEGSGLSARALGQATTTVRIPMAAGIDSLNVAAATAVACWALTSRSRAAPPPT